MSAISQDDEQKLFQLRRRKYCMQYLFWHSIFNYFYTAGGSFKASYQDTDYQSAASNENKFL